MNQATSGRRGATVATRPIRARLQVERLEDRAVPSITILETEPNNAMATANPAPLGFDPGEHTLVTVMGNTAPFGDRDWFRVQLNAGDVLGATVQGQSGLNPALRLFNSAGTLLIFNDDHRGVTSNNGELPPESPLPRLNSNSADSAICYVINTSGAYFFEVGASQDASSGKYRMDLAVARPGLEAQPVGTKQILFIDFDGATVNMSTFGDTDQPGNRTLSPLSRFLPAWGLSAADENAVIDATLAAIRENISDDIRARGLNGDFAASGVPGQFDIEIRNSRDHADEFGVNPLVSRVVIGGTAAEAGRSIAWNSVIDPGNFSFDDDAVVLLDWLSGPPSEPFSLNGFAIDPSSTKIALVGAGIAEVAAHEAGHYFGNFHTDTFSGVPNLMEHLLLPDVGPDGIFGSPDDIDLDFGVDTYADVNVFGFREWFGGVGLNDTLNNISFGLATGKAAALVAASSTPVSGATQPVTVRFEYTIEDEIVWIGPDFNIIANGIGSVRETRFFDREGNLVRVLFQGRYFGSLTNSVTGKTIFDAPSIANIFVDLVKEQESRVGLFWGIEVPGRGSVARDAGRLVAGPDGIIAINGPHEVLREGFALLASLLE